MYSLVWSETLKTGFKATRLRFVTFMIAAASVLLWDSSVGQVLQELVPGYGCGWVSSQGEPTKDREPVGLLVW